MVAHNFHCLEARNIRGEKLRDGILRKVFVHSTDPGENFSVVNDLMYTPHIKRLRCVW